MNGKVLDQEQLLRSEAGLGWAGAELMHRVGRPEQAPFRSGGFTVLQPTASYAVAIPARNEESRVISCLQACLESMQHYGELGLLILLINNTTDRTAEVAISWASEALLPLEVISIILPTHLAHAGGARRLALDRARSFLGETGALLTTDADSAPEREWISENLRQLARRQVLVCGRIGFDGAEVAALLPGTLERGRSEEYYKSLSFELDSLLDPDPLNPWPHHGQTSGASLAMHACAYDLIGGLPVIACGEDRALARVFRENDLPVLFCDRAGVVTSCRTIGRAAGGMAETISIRMVRDDFVCDEQLETADRLVKRATLRSKLRLAMACDSSRLAILADLDLTAAQFRRSSAISSFGTLWSFLEQESRLLQRKPMHREQMERETPRLQAILEKVRADRAHLALPAGASSSVDRRPEE